MNGTNKNDTYQYTIDKPMDWNGVRTFAAEFGVENLQYTYKNSNPTNANTNWADELKKLNKSNNVAHCAFLSNPRQHWYGIQLKMNKKGYIIAKIADSLCPDYKTNPKAQAERQELLNAIKKHNKAVWDKRAANTSVVKRRTAYANAIDKANFLHNGKAYRQIKANDAVQTVTVLQQKTPNSCGLHTAVNLFALDRDPKSTNISAYGQHLEQALDSTKNKVSMNTHFSRKITFTDLAEQIKPKTAPFPQM